MHTGIHSGGTGIIRPSLRNGFNGFLRALPGDEFLFATVAPRIEWSYVPGWADKTSARLSISNGCQDHTTSPYASMPLVLHAPDRSRISPPCDPALRARHRRVHRIPPHVSRRLAVTSLLPRRDGREHRCDLPDGASTDACGTLARRANQAWLACARCPSGGNQLGWLSHRVRPSAGPMITPRLGTKLVAKAGPNWGNDRAPIE